MSETVNSIIEELKNRMTSPFYGKLIVAWLLWNWKIPYVTFFVSEENIDGKNRLDFIVGYLKFENLYEFFIIYLVPLIITIFLIWVFPHITQKAYEAKENFRKKKAVKKKEVDRFIDGNTDRRVRQLSEEIETLKVLKKDNKLLISELQLLSTYLSYEVDLNNDANYDKKLDKFHEKYHEFIENENRDKLLLLIDEYHVYRNNASYLDDLKPDNKNFFIRYDLIVSEENRFVLTEFGEYLSKSRLFSKYHLIIDDHFNNYQNLED